MSEMVKVGVSREGGRAQGWRGLELVPTSVQPRACHLLPRAVISDNDVGSGIVPVPHSGLNLRTLK